MTTKSIKEALAKHNLHIWQLCNQLGISRSTYYKYSHVNFSGYERNIKQAINELIKKGDKSNE